MPTIKTIDPVTRLEGHLKIEVTVDLVNGVQQVVDARATGTLFRGFENMLINRHPWDAQHVTQRICGVCPVSHATAAVLAADAAAKVTAPTNGRIMRNLILAANFIQSHILHFYHLAALDYVDGPAMPPWQPSWAADKRLPAATNTALVNHYVAALAMRRKAHEMGAVFGGRMPDPPVFIAGGVTAPLTAAMVTKYRSYLTELTTFVNSTYAPDVQALGAAYSDYGAIGRGYGNLLAYGVFPQDAAGTNLTLKRGYILNGNVAGKQTLDPNQITEHVTSSWYQAIDGPKPPRAGSTHAQYPKTGAYSWLKAPRYGSNPMEVGALARMTMTDGKNRGVSVLARHIARADETVLLAQAIPTWLNQLAPGQPTIVNAPVPATGEGVGLTEAPRGALGHWTMVGGSKLSAYQIVTPTCWNASPRDGIGQRGPIEQALIGTPVNNLDEPIEVLRVIHSFDPCLSCAVHVARPEEGARIFAVPHVHGEDESPAVTHCHGDEHDHTHDHTH